MCGIFCVITKKQVVSTDLQQDIVDGLRKIQNRGYDSIGIYTNDGYVNKQISDSKLAIDKIVLGNPSTSAVGLGHTRWATHGVISEINAHPHFSQSRNIVGVHNGIVENYKELNLGYNCVSQTDTEVLVNYIENVETFDDCSNIKGKNVLVYYNISDDDVFLFIKNASAIVGFNDERIVITSESHSLNNQKYFRLFDGLYKINFDTIHTLYTELSQSKIHEEEKYVENGHHLKKEIMEQVDYINSSFPDAYILKTLSCHNLLIFGCGSSYISGLYGKRLLDSYGKFNNIICFNACDLTTLPLYGSSVALFLSQSGETADVINAIKIVQAHGIPTLACTNCATSQIAYLCDEHIYLNLGREVSVAATKSFTGFMKLFLKVCDVEFDDYSSLVDEFLGMNFEQYANYDCIFVLGNGLDYPLSLECALKLKELTYIFAQGYPVGELKHGPFALINNKTLVFIIALTDEPHIFNKLISTYEEIQTRGGHPVLICYENDADVNKIELPRLNKDLSVIILFQIISLKIAKAKKNLIDTPKNLAKCVTVI